MKMKENTKIAIKKRRKRKMKEKTRNAKKIKK